MKKYIKSYDTSTESFTSVVKEVLEHPKDTDHLRNLALMDIISNTLAAVREDLHLSFDIDDTNCAVEGDKYKSYYTYNASVYSFSLDKNNQPQFSELSSKEQQQIQKRLEQYLLLPQRDKSTYYMLDVDFYYSDTYGLPRVEISIQRHTL